MTWEGDGMTARACSDALESTAYDVVVVGSGAAALSAATMAAREGASVAVLEAGQRVGGTTWKSSGGFWVPRNRIMRTRAETDERFVDDRSRCIGHMAHLAYPEHYRRDAVRHGLPTPEWDLIVNYYDNVAEVFEDLEDTLEVSFMFMTSFRGDDLGLPSWYETEEDGNTYGRLLAVPPFDAESAEQFDPFAIVTARKGNSAADAMTAIGGAFGDGSDLIRTLLAAATRFGVSVALEHRVVDLVTDADGAVVGAVAETPAGRTTVEARRGVVFGSGGMEHNRELRERFLRGPIVGTCGVSTNRGDFLTIGERLGADLSNTAEAWWAELPLEPCLGSFEQGDLIGQPYGDSMIMVNTAGQRVVNEKESYNERTKAHFVKDPDGRFPNRLLFQILDHAVFADETPWPTRFPLPEPEGTAPFLLRGETLDELAAALEQRLAELAGDTGGVALQPDFRDGLRRTIERFNGFAVTGVDEDFHRGETGPERYFNVESRTDPMPNPTMYPIAETGPYYAFIVGASVLGTKGGPRINARSQVVQPDGTPIPGLYGAGNCIGSPAGAGYWGGGSTLGPALFHGCLAGRNVVLEPARHASVAADPA
jgi:3-oxosteroid 1-dehydrogenase